MIDQKAHVHFCILTPTVILSCWYSYAWWKLVILTSGTIIVGIIRSNGWMLTPPLNDAALLSLIMCSCFNPHCANHPEAQLFSRIMLPITIIFPRKPLTLTSRIFFSSTLLNCWSSCLNLPQTFNENWENWMKSGILVNPQYSIPGIFSRGGICIAAALYTLNLVNLYEKY